MKKIHKNEKKICRKWINYAPSLLFVIWKPDRALWQFENYLSNTDTHQNVSEINCWANCGGAISVTEQNYGPPISKVQRPISDRLTFCVGSEWSLIRPVRCRRFFLVERGWGGGCTRWYPMRAYYLASGGSGRGVGSAENIGLIWGHP